MESVGHVQRRIGGDGARRRWAATAVLAVVGSMLAGACVAPGPGSGLTEGDGWTPPGTIEPGGGGGSLMASTTPSRDDAARGDPSEPVFELARPDVAPAAVVGVTWSAPGTHGRSVVGVVGSRGRLGLPVGEIPLTVGDVIVATTQATEGSRGTIVRVRGLGDGVQPVEIAVDAEVDTGAFAGDRLLLAGHDAAAVGRDPGIVSVSLPDGRMGAIIPASAGPDPEAAYVRTVRVSRSGGTAASGLCTRDGCTLDAIDLRSGAVRNLGPASPDFPGVLTDRVLLVGDPDSSSLAGIDLSTGRRLWERRDAEFQYAYATADGRFVLSYVDHAGPYEFVVAILDPLTGAERVVLRRDLAASLTLWPELSTDAVAILGSGGRFADVASDHGVVQAAALDLTSGAFDPNAVRIQITP